jgi:uncharacterized protein (TIGR02594 family)
MMNITTSVAIPKGYEWLSTVGQLPRTITEALKLFGTHEVVGKGSNKTIMQWRDELNAVAGVNPNSTKIAGYSDDDIPWCGLFAAIVTFRAGKKVVEGPLWAQNWKNFGVKSPDPALGDVLVFKRPSGGHVGFYVGEDATAYFCLGGNQSNSVTITRIAKDRCIAVRRPVYNVTPPSVKPRILKGGGELSKNEA